MLFPTAKDGIANFSPSPSPPQDMHTDDSEVTFNVCLGKEFLASGLTFCGVIGTSAHRQHTLQYPHELGRCVVHLGSQRHGADVITEGERCNLIIWNRNSDFRASALYQPWNQGQYEQESAPPDPVCLSYTHDRDYGQFKQYDPTTAHHRGKGWCPLLTGEYAGFQTELVDPRPIE